MVQNKQNKSELEHTTRKGGIWYKKLVPSSVTKTDNQAKYRAEKDPALSAIKPTKAPKKRGFFHARNPIASTNTPLKNLTRLKTAQDR